MKTSADRIPNNEAGLLSWLFQYRRRREYGKTPVKCTLEINFPVFSSLVNLFPTWRFAACFSSPTPPPSLSVLLYMRKISVKLFCSPYCCWLSGLTVLNFRVQCWDGQLLSPSSKGQGLTLPEMARLKPQKPR